tara:strand:- start:881 stop:1069 length:189 start_codon:yes stop_codon:yes gene_type:complete
MLNSDIHGIRRAIEVINEQELRLDKLHLRLLKLECANDVIGDPRVAAQARKSEVWGGNEQEG